MISSKGIRGKRKWTMKRYAGFLFSIRQYAVFSRQCFYPLFLLYFLASVNSFAMTPPIGTGSAEIQELYNLVENFDFRMDNVVDLSNPVIQPILTNATDEVFLSGLSREGIALSKLWAVAFALNPDLEASRRMVRARAEMYPQTMYVDALAAQYRSFIQGINTRTTSGGMNGGTELIFPGPGVISFNGRLARLEVEMALEEYSMKLRDICAEIYSMSAERESLRLSASVLNETLQVLAAFEVSLKSRFITDKAMYPELSRFQAERSRMINERNRMKRMFDSMLPVINRYLGRAPKSSLGIVDISDNFSLSGNETLVERAIESSQEIRIQKIMIETLKTLSSLKRRSSVAPLSPGFAYSKAGMAEESGSGVGMKMTKGRSDPLVSYRQTFDANPAINHPPEYGRQIAYLRELDRRIEAETAKLFEMRNSLRANFSATLAEYENARLSSITEKSEVIPNLKRGLESASSGYRTGNVSFLEWMELFMKMLDSRMAALRYDLAAQKAISKLLMLMGTVKPLQ